MTGNLDHESEPQRGRASRGVRRRLLLWAVSAAVVGGIAAYALVPRADHRPSAGPAAAPAPGTRPPPDLYEKRGNPSPAARHPDPSAPLQLEPVTSTGGISFADRANGIALGTHCNEVVCEGFARWTGDGGSTWRPVSFPEPGRVPQNAPIPLAVVSLDSHRAYAFGARLWYTRDRGTSWRRVTFPPQLARYELRGIYPEGSVIWALLAPTPCAGSPACLPRLVTGAVGGSALTNVRGRVPIAEGGLARQGRRAWVIGATAEVPSELMYTGDSGRSWRRLASPCRQIHLGRYAFATELHQLSAAPGGVLWADCHFEPGASTGYSEIWVSPDGGYHWRTPHRYDDRYLSGLTAWDARHALADGLYNGIVTTADGGRRWHPTTPLWAGNPIRMWAADRRHLWAAPNLEDGSLYRTGDGGRTWRRLGPIR